MKQNLFVILCLYLVNILAYAAEVSYEYSLDGRLTKATSSNGVAHIYQYDAMGNITGNAVLNVNTTSPVLPGPDLLQPANQQTVSFVDPVLFSWDLKKPNGATYSIYLGETSSSLRLYKSNISTKSISIDLSGYKSTVYWRVNAVSLNHRVSSTTSSVSPLDQDKDGILDHFEINLCTDIKNSDTDGDGLLDGQEDKNFDGRVDQGESNPCQADTDGDGIPDGFEARNGLNPLSAADASEDADKDGFTNLEEYFAHTDYKDATAIPLGTLSTFDDQTTKPFHWFKRDHAGWSLSSDRKANNSGYSLKSNMISHNQSSSIETHIYSPGGLVRFEASVSSEGCCDKLRFYVDGVEKGAWSGESQFVTASAGLTPGKHTLRWTYRKDHSGNTGSDAAWIDNVFLPAVPDSDGDGISDAWEYKSFNTLDHDMTLDSNNDGITDYQDWLAFAAQNK